jgi:hypothetical protein
MFEMNARKMDKRIQSRLSLSEFAAVTVALLLSLAFLWVYRSNAFVDFQVYMRAGKGLFTGYFYAYWILPVFSLMTRLPFDATVMMWNLLGIACVWMACRVFGVKLLPVMVGYQALTYIFYGQITGLLIGGLALSWWAMAHKRWDLAGLGFVIACTKYQFGLAYAVTLWLAAPITLKEKMRILVVPVLTVLATLALYPHWIPDAIARFHSEMPESGGSISLWRWVGAWSLLLFVPVLFVKDTQKKLLLLMLAMTLAIPYFQQDDLTALFLFLPFGFALIGNIGILYVWFGNTALQVLAIIPLLAYALTMVQYIREVKYANWTQTVYGRGALTK